MKLMDIYERNKSYFSKGQYILLDYNLVSKSNTQIKGGNYGIRFYASPF